MQFEPLRRIADRVPIKCPAYIRQGESFDTPATLLNLSSSGFKCEFLYSAEPGEVISLVVRDVGEFPALICWTRGTAIAGSFLLPLEWRHLTAARAAAKRRAKD